MVDEKIPPLGVVPKWLWIKRRKEDLAAAISRYLLAGYSSENEYVTAWLLELNALNYEK